MSQPAEKPCDSLDECRKVVADIEEQLDTMSPRFFTISVLAGYEADLNGIIRMLRTISVEEASQSMKSKDAVLTYVRTARDQLALAINALEKGFNSKFITYLRSCQTNLGEVLNRWKQKTF